MGKDTISLEQVVALARQLSPIDKIKLIERVIPDLEDHLRVPSPGRPLRSVYGLCADLGSAPSAEDIEAMRREVFKDAAP
jgi:hypothetical protein